MKRIIALLLLAYASLAVADGCRTHTYTRKDGTITTCTTCCYNGNCNTTCH